MVGSNGHAWIRPSILTNICMLVRDKYVGPDRRGLTELCVLWELRCPEAGSACRAVPYCASHQCRARGGLPKSMPSARLLVMPVALVLHGEAVGEHEGGLVVLVVLW